tara:strand:- start:529 stop:2043 length:1515 start_codon:yes stop_codon:yes gene_type:complete
MAFNWKAFGTAFLSDQAKGMEERRLENVEYKEELDEEYKAGLLEHKKRKQVVGYVLNQMQRLEQLGASKAQQKAAESAGPEAVFKLAASLAKQSRAVGGRKLTNTEVDAFISGADLFEDDQTAIREFVERSRGMSTAGVEDKVQDDRGFIEMALGFDKKSGTRAKYDARASAVGGRSKLDIIEMARQEAYDSIMGGSFLTLDEAEIYEPIKVNKAFSSYSRELIRTLEETNEYIIAPPDKKEEMRQAEILSAAEEYKGRYGDSFVENLPSAIVKSLGEGAYSVLQDGTESASSSDLTQGLANVIASEDSLPVTDSSNRLKINFDKRGVPISGTYQGERIEPAQLEKISKWAISTGRIVKPRSVAFSDEKVLGPVLPRPDDISFMDALTSRREGGSKFGRLPEEAKQYLGRKILPNVREDGGTGEIRFMTPEQWDEKYGDTHDPKTGELLTSKSASPTEGKKEQAADFTGMKDEKTIDAAFDALPLGAVFTDEDGELRRKTKERN